MPQGFQVSPAMAIGLLKTALKGNKKLQITLIYLLYSIIVSTIVSGKWLFELALYLFT